MNKTRFFTVLVVGVLVCVCGIFAPQASARPLSGLSKLHYQVASTAAASCWEATCNGTDPYSKGCAGGSASYKVLLSAYIRDNSNTILGYVQLWYSATCDTNWARTVAYSPNGVTDTEVYVLGNPGIYEYTNGCTGCLDKHTYQLYIPGPAVAEGSIHTPNLMVFGNSVQQ